MNLAIHLSLTPRLKMQELYLHSPAPIFMAWCLIKHREFTLCLYITEM